MAYNKIIYYDQLLLYDRHMNWLVSWIGHNDIRGMRGETEQGAGPIADFLGLRQFDRVLLLHNRVAEATAFQAWLQLDRGIRADLLGVDVPRPWDFDDVYDKTLRALDELAERLEAFRAGERVYLLSPGTKAMSIALMLIGCTSYRGELHSNWSDESEPDPARRTARVRWPERFTLALWPLYEELESEAEVLSDAEGREITGDAAVKAVYERARRVGLTETTVLISGETGSGKEILARYIHASSRRHDRRFVAVNCGAIPPTLIDSQLFGHARGAFTGASTESPGLVGAARGGTLFLDEVAELPPETQTRLLRLLQDGDYYRVGDTEPCVADVRVIAATHRDLRRMVRAEKFRADLYFRLAQYTLKLPPLRSRPGDLELLCAQALRKEESRRGLAFRIDQGAWQALRAYSWPGNVRELLNVLSRCLVDARPGSGKERIIDGSLVARAVNEQGIGPELGDDAGGDTLAGAIMRRVAGSGRSYSDALYELEAEVLALALRQSRTRAEASRVLRMPSPQALNNKLNTLRKRGFAV